MVENVRTIDALRRTALYYEAQGQPNEEIAEEAEQLWAAANDEAAELLQEWPMRRTIWQGDEAIIDGYRQQLTRTSLSGTITPRVALPDDTDPGVLLRFLRRENLPGSFPERCWRVTGRTVITST